MTYLIIGLTILTSIIAFPPNVASIESLRNPNLLGKLAFHPYSIDQRRQWWRFITSGFVHSSWWHLIINMLVFYWFGPYLEKRFIIDKGFLGGELLFLFFYLSAIAASNFPDFQRNRSNPYFMAVGASGAVNATVFAFILYEPMAKMIIFPFPIPLPAIVVGILLLLYENYMIKRQIEDGIGHYAHLAGALYGILFNIAINPSTVPNFFRQLF